MSIVSIFFPVFLLVTGVLYFALPKKFQWIILLIGSMVFYISSGWSNILYVLFSSAVAWAVTQLMQKETDKQKKYIKDNKEILSKEEKKNYKLHIKKRRKKLMLTGIIPVIFLLVFFKSVPVINSSLESRGFSALSIIIPLGLSYYTLQTVGYIIDVYWNSVTAEKNYFKVLLFVSFFPQVTQGPISDYRQLTSQLFAEHELSYENFSRGIQRLIWGFFKKMVVADALAPYLRSLFDEYQSYSSLTLLVGVILCIIQLYADFSGYMDIVCGACEIFDIKLTENFNRPFFSKSLSEFWTRWHISLGAWFRKYVFYTVGAAEWNKKLSRNIEKSFGENFAEKLPVTVSLFAVWFLIGIWHGVDAAFIVWGIINGLIMIISVWLEPIYDKTKRMLKIRESSSAWKCFQITRNFIIVSFLEVLSDVGGLKNGVGYITRALFTFTIPHSFKELFPHSGSEKIEKLVFLMAFVGLLLMLAVSLIQRRKPVRDYLAKLPVAVRVLLFAVMFYMIIVFGVQATINNDGGFLYAQF